MDQEVPNTKQPSIEKSDRDESAADDDDREETAVVVAIPVDAAPLQEQPPPDIFRLTIDCFEDVLDYLRVEDLISVGKTCKRLQKVSGHCFRQTYPSINKIFVNDTGIAVYCYTFSMDVTHFVEFIHKMQIHGMNQSTFLKFQPKFRRLKDIEFSCYDTTEANIDCMTETLGKIETMSLYYCNLDEHVEWHNIIDHCVKLKRLKIETSNIDTEWFAGKCPTLEYLKFVPLNNRDDDTTLTTFLRLNPNIRKLAIPYDILWCNRESFKNARHIHLDDLAVHIELNYTDVEFGPYCRLLNELYECGFHRRLHLYLEMHPEKTLDELSTLNGLVKLKIVSYRVPFSLPALPNLHEMYSYDDIEQVDAKNLVNIERMHFGSANFDRIIPFIRRSTQLQRIRIRYLRNGTHFNEDTNIVDLIGLNRERQQLADAEKITLYVEEPIYLATKWALGETNFDFIRLKRYDSIEWDDDF